jgi:transposase
MPRDVEEFDADEHEERLERIAAIDVAKASAKVCIRVPHPSLEGRRVTRVFDVTSMTNAIMSLADELAESRIERVVIESTSDYWRTFFYLSAVTEFPI